MKTDFLFQHSCIARTTAHTTCKPPSAPLPTSVPAASNTHHVTPLARPHRRLQHLPPPRVRPARPASHHHALTRPSLYSIHEHHHALPPSASTPPSSTLPIDIVLELLAASALLILSLVLSAPPLRPIRWADWAGKVEREGWDPSADAREEYARKKLGVLPAAPAQGRAVKGGTGNPFRGLEERKGFYDVRAEAKQFADWVRAGAGAAPGAGL